MQVKYIGDTGWLDGTTHGEIYEVKQYEEREDAYTVLKNDLGGYSNLLKSKFITIEE